MAGRDIPIEFFKKFKFGVKDILVVEK